VRVRRREERLRRLRRRPPGGGASRKNNDEGSSREDAKNDDDDDGDLDADDASALRSQLGFVPGNAVCVAARLSRRLDDALRKLAAAGDDDDGPPVEVRNAADDGDDECSTMLPLLKVDDIVFCKENLRDEPVLPCFAHTNFRPLGKIDPRGFYPMLDPRPNAPSKGFQ